MTYIYIATLLVITNIALQSSFCSEDFLEKFVQCKFDEYPKWLRENNSEPSTTVPVPLHIYSKTDVIEFEGQLFNHNVSSLSQNHTLAVYPSSPYDYIRFKYVTPQFTVKGDFIANGTLYPSIPFSGGGQWNLTAEVLITDMILDFEITELGFINNTSVHLPYQFPPYDVSVYFEGLWNNSDMDKYARYIKEEIKNGFFSYFHQSM